MVSNASLASTSLKLIFAVGVASEDYLADWQNETIKTGILAFSYLLLSGLRKLHFRLLKKVENNEYTLAERVTPKTIIDNEPECIKIVDVSGLPDRNESCWTCASRSQLIS